MTCIAYLRNKDSIFLAADRQTTGGNNMEKKEEPKFSTIGFSEGNKKKQMYMALTGYSFVAVYLKNFDAPPKSSDVSFQHYLMNSFLPQFVKSMKEKNAIWIDKELAETDSLFYIIYDNVVYSIYDVHLTTINKEAPYGAIGSGSFAALGSLYSSTDLPPKKRVKLAIEAAAYHTTYVDNNIDVIEIKKDSYNV